jgi:hypothetical protein
VFGADNAFQFSQFREFRTRVPGITYYAEFTVVTVLQYQYCITTNDSQIRMIKADAYLEQNVFAKQKIGADFVNSIPYDRISQNKTCCTFCEAGLPKPVSQNMQHVLLLGSGFEQNLHKADPKSYRTKCR